jgi:hypothetical protein
MAFAGPTKFGQLHISYVAWIRVWISYRIRYGYSDTAILKNLRYDTAILYIIFIILTILLIQHFYYTTV